MARVGHREGNGSPLQCSFLENPRDGGAWWAAVCGVAQSRTRLKRFSSSSISRLGQTLVTKKPQNATAQTHKSLILSQSTAQVSCFSLTWAVRNTGWWKLHIYEFQTSLVVAFPAHWKGRICVDITSTNLKQLTPNCLHMSKRDKPFESLLINPLNSIGDLAITDLLNWIQGGRLPAFDLWQRFVGSSFLWAINGIHSSGEMFSLAMEAEQWAIWLAKTEWHSVEARSSVTVGTVANAQGCRLYLFFSS